MLKRFFSYLHYRIFYIWLFFFSFLTVVINSEASLAYTLFSTFILYYLIYVLSEKLFTAVILFVTATLSLYYPVSLYYGSLNSGIIAAFLETNISESLEFMSVFSFSDFLLPFLFCLSAIILIRLKRYNISARNYSEKKAIYTLLFFGFLFSLVFEPTKYYLEESEEDEHRWTLANTPINVVSFYANIYESFSGYYFEKKELESAFKKPNPWQVIEALPKYRNYVLIIGESARRDYFSTYGFSLPTTPFLDRSLGYINAGYISAAPATYHSLLKSLYFRVSNKIDYSYHIINLAKKADIQTYWFSNQGSIGKYDSSASRIGASSDFYFFTKKGAFNTGDVDDFTLLDEFKMRLAKSSTTNKKASLFVFHLMGSHQKFCSRLKKDEHILKFVNKDMSCYVNTILKTDKLIENIVSILKEKNESYSLIYFSDHGLSHIKKDDLERLSLDYSEKNQSNYMVPFFKLSSDDTKREVTNIKRSAVNFIYGFSQWLGIKTKELSSDYDFFSYENDKDIKVFDFRKNVYFDSLETDPIPSFEKELIK